MDSSELEAGYKEMSQNDEREAEALEWCEALIVDVACDDPGTED
jgi:hypothetical protein